MAIAMKEVKKAHKINWCNRCKTVTLHTAEGFCTKCFFRLHGEITSRLIVIDKYTPEEAIARAYDIITQKEGSK